MPASPFPSLGQEGGGGGAGWGCVSVHFVSGSESEQPLFGRKVSLQPQLPTGIDSGGRRRPQEFQ